jgi:hypothetical protein
MINQIMVCLDGSPLAERILPLAKAIASAECATLTLLRVVKDSAEVSRQENYVREPARPAARTSSLSFATIQHQLSSKNWRTSRRLSRQ